MYLTSKVVIEKEKIKKPRGLQNTLHDDYVKCKEECRKIEEREITEKYIQYLKTELEAAELVVAQESAALQATSIVSSNNQNENKLDQVPSEDSILKSEKETFVQEENLIV
ncbi:Hypothetical protein SRAE_X000015300 [Strongyloides ratti]|uniref:Uncharacterized protein n=1 Tax=Strongyloides ratti TaxID=34506 RepID=A0A090N0K0_STRRB|nr:Hypothetical protein SRAE_X000015300 [Strongyloides ratti]CEF70823.1 Hypothetical protein SRAE_X000015300 [Strongyloides ratti]